MQTGLDESAWADIRAKYPNVNFPEGMNPAYAALYAANQEMVGWLKIPNMKYIDFPIVQGKDNDKYLSSIITDGQRVTEIHFWISATISKSLTATRSYLGTICAPAIRCFPS